MNRPIRCAHFLQYGRSQAGIYGTAKDLILAERAEGIDAQAIDFGSDAYPKYHSRVGCKDDELETISPDWAKTADILVRHSAIPPEIDKLGKPTVFTLHGTPEYAFRLEHAKKANIYREIIRSVKKATVVLTFWKEHLFEWETLLDGKAIEYCPAIVDLKKYNPEGKKYNLSTDTINIVSTGMWRNEYRMPYQVMWAAAEVVKEQPDVKLFIFACPKDKQKEAPIKRLIYQMKKVGLVHGAYGLVTNLPEIYCGADLALTPHVVASRTVRESLACGCPIVAGSGNLYTNYTANPDNRQIFKSEIERCIDDIRKEGISMRQAARSVAEKNFAPALAGKRMKEIFEGVLTNV